MCARGIEPTSSEKATAHTEPSLQTFNFTNVFVCLWLCLCVCGGGITIQNILVKALCRQDRKIQDTMHHIFKVHFIFCLLASRGP